MSGPPISRRTVLAAAPALMLAARARAAANEITIVQGTDATSMDPAFRGDTVTGNVQRHVYDTLLVRNPDLTIGPGLVESLEGSNGTDWVLHLRKGVAFSNGEPFDAAAVKFSIERVQNPALKSPIRGWWLPFKTVEAVDSHTVKIVTATRDPLFQARLSLFAPVPPHYVAQVGDTAFAQKPVGTGRYLLKEWRRNDSAVFVPNPGYWGGKAGFSKVTFRVVPEEMSRVAALMSGEADVISGLSPSQAEYLRSQSGMKVVQTPSTRVMAIQFDIGMPPGDNQKFREAVACGINQEEIIKGLLRGFGTKVTSLLSPAIPGWPRDKTYTTPFDPKKAAALVKEAGLEKAEVLMRTPAGGFPNDREVALAIGAQLGRIGLDVKVRPDEYGRFFADLKDHRVSPLYYNGQGNIWLDPYPQLEAFHKSNGFLSTWKDPELDKILAQSFEVSGAQREAVFGQALDRIASTVAAVPVYAQVLIFGIGSAIEWQPRSDEQVLAFEMRRKA
jgi:peptide/nickel transport system substrate-binding protein